MLTFHKNKEVNMAQERLTMRKIREILRLKYEAKLSNRAIAGACKVSNSTVGEYLRRAKTAGISWPIGDIDEDELYKQLFPEKERDPTQRVIPLPDWEEIRKEKLRKGVTLQLLWQEYKEKHPEGFQYSQFCHHYQQWRQTQKVPIKRIEHVGGEQMQVDYAGLKIPITDPQTGRTKEAVVFVVVLPASNFSYAEVQLKADQCHWNNAHVRAFEFFGGVVKIVVPDNLKTGITKPNYYEPDVNMAYQELAEHYKFAVLPARVRKPRDKGKVENGVLNVERWVIAPLRHRRFFSVYEAEKAVKEQLDKLNNKIMKAVGRSRRQEFEEIDLPYLQPLPERRYEYIEIKTAKVNIDYHIEFEKHFYSVSYHLIHQRVEVRASERMIEVYYKGKPVAFHPRSFRMGRFSTLREHMPDNHKFIEDMSAERLIQWAHSIGPQTSMMIRAALASKSVPQQAYRTCLGIIRLGKKYPYPLLEQACQSAVEANVFSYKAVKQELELLQNQAGSAIPESLPTHENIRGADYYQERIMS
jgi:transposase